MGVIGIATAQFQAREHPVTQSYVAFEIEAQLFEADGNGLFALFLFFFAAFFLAVMMPAFRIADEAIIGVEIADRSAEAGLAEEYAKAARRCPSLGRAIGQDTALLGCFAKLFCFLELALFFLFCCIAKQVSAQIIGQLETGDLEIICLAPRTANMHCKILAQTRIERNRTAAQIAGRVSRGQSFNEQPILRHGKRDAAVNHVHNAANRLAAEQERSWPAQNLDPLNRQRVNRSRMV